MIAFPAPNLQWFNSCRNEQDSFPRKMTQCCFHPSQYTGDLDSPICCRTQEFWAETSLTTILISVPKWISKDSKDLFIYSPRKKTLWENWEIENLGDSLAMEHAGGEAVGARPLPLPSLSRGRQCLPSLDSAPTWSLTGVSFPNLPFKHMCFCL